MDADSKEEMERKLKKLILVSMLALGFLVAVVLLLNTIA